jgi:ABC-type amino acid transport substrate-binding protein
MQRRGFTAGLAAGLFALAAPPVFARCEAVAPSARPQNTPRDFVGQGLDEIVARGYLTIAVYDAFPPYSWLDAAGQPQGIDIGVGRILAQALGVEPRFNFVLAGENLGQDLMSYVWRGTVLDEPVSNVMMRVPYNLDFACTVDQVVFTGQYAAEQIAIAYSRTAYPDAVPSDLPRHEGAPVPAFFRYDSVAVENDSIADFYLTAFPGGQIGPNIHRFPQMSEAMAALKTGEVMAAMGPQAQLQYGADKGVAVHTPPLPQFALAKWTLGLAVHQSHRDLAYALDDAVAAALADGRIAKVYADLGLSFTPPER